MIKLFCVNFSYKQKHHRMFKDFFSVEKKIPVQIFQFSDNSKKSVRELNYSDAPRLPT